MHLQSLRNGKEKTAEINVSSLSPQNCGDLIVRFITYQIHWWHWMEWFATLQGYGC
jgi:hypothetical protein